MAKKRGDLTVMVPGIYELFLDIDCQKAASPSLERVEKRIRNFAKRLKKLGFTRTMTWKTKPSQTVGNYHIIVTMPFPLSDAERIALQLLLGSDPEREEHALLNHFVNVMAQDPDERYVPPTAFFESTPTSAEENK